MNCPKCGEPLRISKKDPTFGLCDHCKKKFKLPDSPTQDALDDTDPVIKPSKSVTDETKIMKTIQAIDNEIIDETPVPHATPKKKRPDAQKKHTEDQKKRPETPKKRPETPKKRPEAQKRRPEAQKNRPGSSQNHQPSENRKPKKPVQSGYYTDDQYDNEPHHKKKKYANIPPSKVRSSREDDMRAGYDELLSIENEKQGIGSKILTILLFVVILAFIGVGVFYLYHHVSSGKSSSTIDAAAENNTELSSNDTVIYEDEDIEVLI